MRVVRYIPTLFMVCLVACNGKTDNNILTYRLKRSDYSDIINVTGTVQAVVSTPVMSPPSTFGQMTIVKLAKDGFFVKKGDTLCVLTVTELLSRYKEILISIETLEAELKKSEADNKMNLAL